MKKAVLNIILIMATIIGTVMLLVHDVHAGEEDIPDGYEKQNVTVTWNSTDNNNDVYYAYDFDIYYPSEYDIMLLYSQGYYNAELYLRVCNKENPSLTKDVPLDTEFNGGTRTASKAVKSTVSGIEFETEVYIRLNSAVCTKDSIINDTSTVDVLSKLDFTIMPQKTDRGLNSVNISYPYLWNPYRSDTYYCMIGNYDTSSAYFTYVKDDASNAYDVIYDIYGEYKEVVKIYNNDVIQYPSLDHAILIPSGRLMLYYCFDTEKKAPVRANVYDKIYVKLRGEDWTTVDNASRQDEENPCLLTFSKDNSTGTLSGHISIKELTLALGRDEATYEAVIWGLQYVYATGTGGMTPDSIEKTDWYFSRYVFEENLIDSDVEVSVNDLGGLTDVTGGSSSIVVDIPGGKGGGTSGSTDTAYGTPNIIIDDTSVNSVSDFINALKWDFSSISSAVSSVSSLAVQFAGFIGNVFSALFGEPLFIIVLLSIGCAVILRVVGR